MFNAYGLDEKKQISKDGFVKGCFDVLGLGSDSKDMKLLIEFLKLENGKLDLDLFYKEVHRALERQTDTKIEAKGDYFQIPGLVDPGDAVPVPRYNFGEASKLDDARERIKNHYMLLHEKNLQKIVAYFDRRNNNKVAKGDFMNNVAKDIPKLLTADVNGLFDLFDKDKSGYIPNDRFEDLFREKGHIPDYPVGNFFSFIFFIF